jgi:hypothetical protein
MEMSGQLHVPVTSPQGKRGRYTLDRRMFWAGLDAEAKKKSHPLPGIEPRSSSPCPSLYTDWATPASLIAMQGTVTLFVKGSRLNQDVEYL